MARSRGSIALLGLLAALLIVYVQTRSLSPGPISAVHAQDPELLGGAGCAVCHGDGQLGMTSSCLQCHEELDTQLAAGRGLHAQVPDVLLNECERCHTEHQGRDFRIVGRRSFMVAGYADREEYDHQGLDFSLEGAHLKLGCADCHELADVELLTAGSRRFMSLQQSCTECHEDPHAGEQPDCASCHGQEEKFQVVPLFEHDPKFALVGGHAGVGCVDCHERGTEHSVDEVLRDPPGREPRDCAECHDSPHAESFLAEVASSLGSTVQQSCARCHPVEKQAFRAPLAELDAELHAATGFSLSDPHRDLSCEQCHEGYGKRTYGPADWDTWAFERLYPGRHPDDCNVCHGDPHDGEFAAGPFKGGDCLACHERHGFQPPRFTIAQHAQTRFPLTGGHLAVGCNDCHKVVESVSGSSRRQFRSTPRACESCHDDVHEGTFDRPGLPVRLGGRIGCARCHVTTSFSTVDTESFDHNAFTEFPLRGNHAKAECTDCHTKGSAGRTFAKADRTCAQCHEDPHVGQFRSGARTDCAQCHRDDGTFQDLVFDHEQDSRFSLGESHVDLACSACHKSYALPDGGSVVRYKPLGILCTDCHGDMHGDAGGKRDSRGRRRR